MQPTTIQSVSLSKQGGIALITAVFIIAIIVTATASMALEQQVWIRQIQNLNDRAQASSVRRGAVDGAIVALLEDLKNSNTDDLTEEWATTPLANEKEEDVGGGFFFGVIEDAQARFNINNLLKDDNNASPEHADMFRRLLRSQQLDASLADAVIDWLDDDTRQRSFGAEDLDYMGQTPPYRAANREFQSIEELRLVKNFKPETVEKLRDLIVALPRGTGININTAPEEVLAAMFTPAVSSSAIKDLAEEKKDKPFANKSELLQRLHLPADRAPKVEYDVKTDYFTVTVTTTFGRLTRNSQALIHRVDKTNAEVLWHGQQFFYPGPKRDDDTEQTEQPQ